MRSGEITHINMNSLCYDLTGGRTQIYRTRGEYADRYTTDADGVDLQLNTKVF